MSTNTFFLEASNSTVALNASSNATCPTVPPLNFTAVQTKLTSFFATFLNTSVLVANLAQNLTNGPGTTLGTLDAKPLPQFLTSNSTTTGIPWGNATVSNRNPENPPNTGITRFYDLTISRGVLSPDGVNRSMLLINGQFPGPLIEANWGDTINVTVHNQIDFSDDDGMPLEEEGTALHWHGILQKLTPYYDGVPSVGQCPIAPDASFTYSFQADLYGTSWYHSHYSAQYGGGIVGPMIIYGPSSAPYDIDLGPVFISDWYHDDYYRLVEQSVDPSQPVVFSNNTLINGKMVYDCDVVEEGHSCTPNAGVSKFQFTTGKTHRLRLINSGAEALQQFTIDNHTMTVIANDFVSIVPYETTNVTLGIGQRTDVLVTATGNSGDAYWMRVTSNQNCSAAVQPLAFAAIYYDGADTNTAPGPDSVAQTLVQDVVCLNEPLAKTEPSFQMTPPSQPATTQIIQVAVHNNETCSALFYMNNSTFRADYNAPILISASEGNLSFPEQWNVYNFGSNSSVRLYVNNTTPISHPMHLHGHNFWVLAQGQGEWDGTIQGNAQNPQRRDVQLMPTANVTTNGTLVAPGYIVIEYMTDNPGVWPFHCHIAWHVGAGLYINTIEHPDQITETAIPEVNAETCTNWQAFTNQQAPDQIDSGLRFARSFQS